MEAADSLLRPGYRLDRYELLCPIASGGMATVWLARLRGKRGFEKLFAIKTIRTELGDDPRFQEMFLDEARISSGIQHPNVAQILDLGEQENLLYIVMEWVDGESLAKIRKLVGKRKAVLPIGIALRVLSDACAGLHSAHELRDDAGEPLGIVHRDVSPQNILVSTAGVSKIIDFGIAKAQNRKQGETRTGVVKGKIQYLAPEQVKRERRVDRRTDVWALGACLHELVTGRLPYEDDDDLETIRKLMAEEPPLLVEGVPEPVRAVLDRSLALDPAKRFPTAASMQRALEAAAGALGEVKTSEDVSSFLQSECPELATRRKGIVSKAIEEARGRSASGADSGEAALAPTLMGDMAALSQRGRDSDVGTVELVKRKPAQSAAQPATNASVELDRDSLVIPKRSLAWLWVLLLMAGGVGAAAFKFPAERERVLAAIGLAGGDSPGPGTNALPAPPASSPLPPASTAAPMLSATASARAAPSTSPVASTIASAAAATSASATPSASPSSSAPTAASSVPSAAASATIDAGPHHAVAAAHPTPAPEEPVAAEPTSTTPYSIYKTVPPASASVPTTIPPAPQPAPSAAASSGNGNPY
jgi:serine/threonine-protein kinase